MIKLVEARLQLGFLFPKLFCEISDGPHNYFILTRCRLDIRSGCRHIFKILDSSQLLNQTARDLLAFRISFIFYIH